MTTQRQIILEKESDNYFQRNINILKNYNPETDPVINVIEEYNIKPNRVLEIGCNAGYRLDAINRKLKIKVHGIEPSIEAITYGQKHYENVNFHKGMMDNLTIFEDNYFDLVIIGFVLYVVDRTTLLKSIAELDRVLKDNGNLIIVDFYTNFPLKNNYKHINEIKAYTYKQNYDDILTASRLYQLTDRRSYNLTNAQLDSSFDFQNKMSVTLLQKSIDNGHANIY